MSDLFENKIKEYANEIFGSEPVNGHRDRFAEKLASQKKSNRIPVRQIMVYVAATAAILIGLIFFMPFFELGTGSGDSLVEVQNYYAMQFEDKVSEIKVLLEQIENDDKKTVLKDIEKMKLDMTLTLQTTEEESIPFIVGLYASKMEALEHIRDILE